MSIQVVTYDLGSHHIEVDHEWPNEDEQAEREAREYAEALSANDKSTDHVTYITHV
jgi:hypothetical protein